MSAEVVDRKVSRGHTFLVTNGGLHRRLAAWRPGGAQNFPVVMATGSWGNRTGGRIGCRAALHPLDLLADRMELAKAEVGDLIVVFQSGAYGLTASPARFLGHPACWRC